MKTKTVDAKDRIAAQIFKAQEIIRENMTRQRAIDEVARMSGNETAAGMFDE